MTNETLSDKIHIGYEKNSIEVEDVFPEGKKFKFHESCLEDYKKLQID